MSLPLALVPIVAQAVPALVRWMTRSERAGDIAESVVGVVETVTGLPARSEAEAGVAAARLAADPAAMAQLQAALVEIGLREAELAMADRKDARQRDVELRRLGGGNRRADVLIAAVIALLVAAGFAMFWAVDETMRNILSAGMGALLGMLKDAFGFEFGSSRGSADKQRTIESALGAAQGAGAGDALAAWKAGR